ncbi:MAG: RIP metalloprotease RseP [Acidobacteria bacterium]|jgi:regulator of sigma E protease|nr:RIP metalloprotease RseP [Acidobacteriota bacterium]MDP7338473.1 RIP metalloprotease RseP [Vicinamibacterales bacterium]MDP7479085.1 RIP metalloprotease RseP [Vicinamibacterales bacterium]MDP7691407.1 RIP metalloprotease RseP [Vicinamibacterales bacterium]HJN45589.1 RIP metalloprotease RseP [Vicinamibacterales bacterium]|tara:strand:- start:156 stop:1475 length:1320 start_codon:yes stop_codon:yes gene_type:complete
MNGLLAFLFVLGVLVFVHELGHFLLARRHGVRCLTFSLGFGPKLLQTKRGDTVYCISAIPLGGYVKMAGESPEDEREGKDDEFLSKSKWQRFQILIAGPAMNIILAVVVMTVVLYQGAQIPAYEDQPPVVGSVAEDSPAEAAGIRLGDRILSVAGRQVDTWDELVYAVVPRADQEIDVVLRDASGVRTVQVTPAAQTSYNLGDLGVGPDVSPQVVAWSPTSSSARDAGILIGDVIEAVEGRDVSQETLVELINASPDTPVTLRIRRDGVPQNIVVTPQLVDDVGVIGVALNPFELHTIEPGPVEAFTMSLEQNYEWSGLIFQTLWGLLTRDTSPSQLVGPVGIAQLSGDAAQVGWVTLFGLMSMISLNLGILNLLPIPILDGGHIFIMAMEGVSRRDFSVRLKERMLLAGFVVLMSLMVTVIYNDLTRVEWVERLMIWR